MGGYQILGGYQVLLKVKSCTVIWSKVDRAEPIWFLAPPAISHKFIVGNIILSWNYSVLFGRNYSMKSISDLNLKLDGPEYNFKLSDQMLQKSNKGM